MSYFFGGIFIMNYEINENTLAILYDGYDKTKIIELGNEYEINEKAYKIMEENCEYYGSTYVGRIKAAKKMLNCSYKIPVLVEESNSLIFFPTMSSLAEECSWINYSAIQDYAKKNNFVELRFENNKKIDIDMSKISLENQLARSSRLESIIRNRRRQ